MSKTSLDVTLTKDFSCHSTCLTLVDTKVNIVCGDGINNFCLSVDEDDFKSLTREYLDAIELRDKRDKLRRN